MVAKDFNPKCFINCHDYENFEQVIERIIEIDNNDDLYKNYLNEPAFIDIKNEFINEKLIYQRFDDIFSNKKLVKMSAKKTDIFKYYIIILLYYYIIILPILLTRVIRKAYRALKKIISKRS